MWRIQRIQWIRVLLCFNILLLVFVLRQFDPVSMYRPIHRGKYSTRHCNVHKTWCSDISASFEIHRNIKHLSQQCPWNDPVHRYKKLKPTISSLLVLDKVSILELSKFSMNYPVQIMPVHLGHEHVGSWNETFHFLFALIRCGHNIAVARYGDGELSVINGDQYQSETDISNWKFNSSNIGFPKMLDLIVDGFALAADSGPVSDSGGMFIGLPFYYCLEGLRHFRFGGGGMMSWLKAMINSPRVKQYIARISQNRMVYSWQWGNLNYPSTIEMVHKLAMRRRIILICNDRVANGTHSLPWWVDFVFTVSSDGVDWFMSNIDQLTYNAVHIAKSFQNHIFLISAGPMSNALIPLMFRANPNNTYLDMGGTLDFEVHHLRTRGFHPDFENPHNSKVRLS
mmetsp:Transcript_48486/g.128267  ORF Transcript_48486/g.128267 Transcript_48486/m.128267 type:complete len:397 (-) Transcript_48486:676-1866(-)